MRFHQSTGARTLSLALAGIGLIAVAAPASAEDAFKTRVELTRVVQKEAGGYRVKGRIHSPNERCRQSKSRAVFVAQQGFAFASPYFKDPTITRRGKFSIRVPQSAEGTFRVKAKPERGVNGAPSIFGLRCEGDKSRRFTLPPASEAGVAAAATASAAADVVKYDTKVELGLHNHERFIYNVQSEGEKACERGRRVVLFQPRHGPDRKLDTARSEYRSERHRGEAVLIARLRQTVVYARVRREVHDEFVCRGDRSKVHDDR